MTKLSKPQQEALDKMKDGEWHTAYNLRPSNRQGWNTIMGTLRSLEKKGLIESKEKCGSSKFYPYSEILWRIKGRS